jgi:hypothetical protein
MRKPDAWERDVQEWNEHTRALKMTCGFGLGKLGLERALPTRTL